MNARSLPLGLATALVALFGLVALAAPLLAPHAINDVVGPGWQAPTATAWLGTDMIGRDVLSRLVWSTRTTLALAGAATLISVGGGVVLGLLAALWSGWIEAVLSRLVDLLLSIPTLIFVLLLVAILPRQPVWLVAAVALVEITRVYRLSRLLAAEIATREFVDAARMRGETRIWIALNEILPNCWRVLLSEAALRFCFAILLLSTISFLGLGIQPPSTDWGTLIQENKDGMLFGAWAALVPGAAIAVLSLSMGVLADAIADHGDRHG